MTRAKYTEIMEKTKDEIKQLMTGCEKQLKFLEIEGNSRQK